MKDRTGEDFSGVVANLRFGNADIVPVPKKFDNATGVYHSEKAKEGFQYVAAFATVDDHGVTWVETFGVEKDGVKMVLRGRAGSSLIGKDPSEATVRSKATEMIEQWLGPH